VATTGIPWAARLSRTAASRRTPNGLKSAERDQFLRAAAADQQPAVEFGVQFAQAVPEELQSAWAGGGLQTGIQDEAGQHIGAVGGFQQGRQVAEAKVAAKPQDVRHAPMLPGGDCPRQAEEGPTAAA
jgi:hypothetical protein